MYKYYCKIKSGSLQLVTYIAVLIAILLALLIILAQTFSIFKQQSKISLELIDEAYLKIYSGLRTDNIFNDTITERSGINNNRLIKSYSSQWGIFEKLYVCAKDGNKTSDQVSIMGSEMISSQGPTLFLQETYNPLTLVGNSVIEGNVFLPSQGVKPGYINGESYYGNKLVNGEIKKSDLSLPEIAPYFLEGLQKYLWDSDFEASFTQSRLQKTIRNSFKDKTIIISLEGEIILEDVSLSGNVIVKSDVSVYVSNTAELKDIVLIAPKIYIEDGVKGVFQAIASKSIKLGKGCKLSYPSSLILYQPEISNQDTAASDFENQIYIDSGSSVSGTICYFNNGSGNNFKTNITLAKDSQIRGQVYCQGNFEISGSVLGNTFVKQFIVNKGGSIFMNHIYNGVITNKGIPVKSAGIVFKGQKKAVMKWMY